MRRAGFDVLELCLVASFVFLATWTLTTRSSQAARPVWFVDPDWESRLTAKYGAERFSSGLEEFLVRDFFNDLRAGVFVDVGASDAVKGSNTYRLERDFGWSGLAVDADAGVASSYRMRPRTRHILAFVGAVDSGTAMLHRGEAGASSGQRQFTEQFGTISGVAEVPQRSLASLLQQHDIGRIDFLSMDIELSEPAALSTFPIDSYRPRLVCVEAHQPTRQWLLNYFARNDYVLVADYLPADRLNLWFRPLDMKEPGPIPAIAEP